jgi:hypothetical protein
MSDSYTLKYFADHYIEHRGVADKDKEATREAFMGGAHTLLLMMTNFLQTPNPEPEIRRITQELSEFMLIKQAEDQVKTATVH